MLIIHGKPAGSRSEQRSQTFTGDVWADPVLALTDGVTVNRVFFSPGARTFWHSHERGQLLLVSDGEGWVRRRDGRTERITTGDLVWTPPDEEHWHGAADVHVLVHLAVSLGTTSWGEPVSDDDYPASGGPR